MASLTAVFQLVDNMSDKMDAIASRGESAVDSWERMGEAADSAQQVGVAAAASVASAVSDYENAVEGAAGTTDYWTSAVENYDKSALEAVYSTQELVDMGLKSADALEEERSVMELAEMATEDLNNAIEASAGVHEECTEAMSKSADIAEQMADSDKVSQAAKEALQEATESAAAAMEELEAAQKAAQDAQENYNAVTESGTATIGELEAAALNAAEAADNLAAANEKAMNATEELSKANEDAAEEAENANKKGVDAVESVASALAATGITATVKEISESVYDLADAFSEAESTVVLATGATGDALDGLTDSMMDAYATSKTGTLDDTAAAVGEINTRLGYTGDKLTETTELFLDFADVTGGNAASSVKSVTQLMNQWNVSADETESVLSKLTYAGQASGISVDTLSSQLITNKAVLDQLGFSLDEATAMFMQFELSGTQTTTVMTGLRTALSSGAISSLEELYDVLDQLADGTMTATDATEIFGSRAGTAITNAAQQGVFELDEMVAALENSSGTLETTAVAAQTLDEKWEQATNNVSAAFTSVLEPSISGASSEFAGFVNNIGDYLNDHPTVVKAITAVGTVLGTVAVAFAAVSAAVGIYNTVTAISTAVTTAFGVSLSAVLGPITLVATAVAAVVVVVSELIDYCDKADEEVQGMTATTRAQYYELQDLNAEYAEACEKYGETSDEASTLKYQIDDLTEEFEANKQTVEELVAEVDDLVSAHDDLYASFDEATAAIDDEEISNLALIAKLDDLASSSDGTAASQEAMQSIIDELNGSIDGLNLTYEDLISNQDATVENIKAIAEAEAEQQRQQEKYEEYVELIKQQADEEAELAKLSDELAAAQERAAEANDAYMDKWNEYTANGANSMGEIALMWSDEKAEMEAASEALDEVTTSYDELQSNLEETNASIAEIEASFEDVADATDDTTEATIDYQAAAETAYASVQEEVEALVQAYEEAYDAALESFEGQFGLFDEASTKSEEYLESTVSAAQEALDSQLEYWESYNANLETLTEYGEGLTGEAKENYEALLEYASDGSEEAAGLAASMAEAITSGDEAAVEDLSNTLADVTAQQETAAATTADWQTNFTEQMQGYADEMTQIMTDDLNLSDEAADSAQATITSYANQILSSKASAVSAAQSVADAVSAALSSANTSISVKTSTSVSGHAKGTTDAEDVFIAGEEGPELIVGKQGSTVFPNSETEKIIDAVSEPQKSGSVVTVVNNSATSAGTTDASALLDRMELSISKLADTVSELLGTQPDNTLDVAAHASGTTSSGDSFIAGENGPELVIGHPDSTVFPTEETDRIVDAIAMMYREPQETVERMEQTVVNNAGDVLNEYSNAYDNSEGDSIDQRTYESSQTSVDSSDQRSYAYDYSEAIDQIAGDVLNEYSNAYDNSEEISYDYSQVIDQSSGDVINEYEYGQDNGGIVAAGDTDHSESEVIYVPADSGSAREDTSTSSSSGDRKITLEIEGKGNIQLQGGKVDEETMLAFLYQYLKPVLSEILKQEVYEEGDYSYGY